MCGTSRSGSLTFLDMCQAATGKVANLDGTTHSTWRMLLRQTFRLPDAGTAMMAVL